MKPITLPMAELKPALIGLGKLIQKSHGLPVLKTVKVERTAEGWVALTATDLDAYATVRLEQPAEGEALALLVPHEELARTVKTCAKDENILVAPGAKNTGFIQYGLGSQLAEIEFDSLPVAEFPEAPSINAAPIPLPEPLRTSIQQTLECSNTDCTRLVLNGVCLDVSNTKAHYVTLRRDVVAPLVLVKNGIEPGDTLPVGPAPVDDARFRARHPGLFKKPSHLAHSNGVILRFFRSVPNRAEPVTAKSRISADSLPHRGHSRRDLRCIRHTPSRAIPTSAVAASGTALIPACTVSPATSL
jgi:hypothetical protein